MFVGRVSAERELCLSRVFLTEVFDKISFSLVASVMDAARRLIFKTLLFRFNLAQ